MTKPVLITLLLAGLLLAMMRVWFFDQPATDQNSSGTEYEPAQSLAGDSSSHSRSGWRDAAAASSAINMNPNSPATPTAGSAATAASAPDVSASKSPRPAWGERPASVFPNDEQARGLAISGLVQDKEGYPLANIKVQAEPIRPPDADRFAEDQTIEDARSVLTDFDGSFYFGNLSDDEYRIHAAPLNGFAAAETKARVGEMSAILVLEWMRDVRVFGIVNSTEETPLEDVRVIAGPPTVVTDSGPQGHYQLDISIKGKNRPYTVHFRRDGYRDQAIRLTAADLEDLLDFQLDVSMEPLKGLTAVTGSLKDPEGLPVVGKILNLRSSKLQTSYRAQSDMKGHFSIGDVEPGKDYQLSVRPGADFRNYERAQLEIPADGMELDIVLESLGEGELSGWMTNVDGQPIPGFAMTLSSKVAAGQSVQVVGDYQGFFMVEGFPEGGAILKTNSYPFFEVQGIQASPETEEPVMVVLDIGQQALFGQVTNGFGDAVTAPEVTLGWQFSESGVQNYSVRKTVADQNGNFAFTGLGSGVHTLRVNAPGFSMAVIRVDVGTDPDTIVVELNEES